MKPLKGMPFRLDGSHEEIPIRVGIDVGDRWDTGEGASEAQIAWTGQNEAAIATARNIHIQLFTKTWQNPHPEREINSLDMVAGDQPSGEVAPAPFLIAVSGR